MMNLVGLSTDNNGKYIYLAQNAVVTSGGVNALEKSDPPTFALNTSACCGTSQAVQELYEELVAFEESDCRVPALVAAITAGWLSVFAEKIKFHGLQVPAIVYIGDQQSGKTSFAAATTLLKQVPGGKTFNIWI